jgi:DNA-binding transcriptional regulator YiaG
VSVFYIRCAVNGTLGVRVVAAATYPARPGEYGPVNATNEAHALRIAARIFETPAQSKQRTRPSTVAKLIRKHRGLTTFQLAAKFGLSEQRVREIRRTAETSRGARP